MNLIKSIQDALQTAEEGENLVAVARDACRAEQELASIERSIQEADSAMTPKQYKQAIKALGLSQERAGKWLGISPRASQGYALGEYPVPEPTAKLLRLMIHLKLKPEDVS